MKPERWRQVNEVFQAALACSAAERAAVLSQACGEDEALRREVEVLLASDQKTLSLLAAPVYPVAAPLQVETPPAILQGKTLGHYQIVSLLGRGGMGEVYCARDLKLDRMVALKLLPAEVANDKERMQRFVREAKTASALNHPHVATIYEIGAASTETGGVSFIAMEYVEGHSLAAKINGQPLPISEIVAIGQQIADALEEAHSKGIIHRDIKPANVMLTAREQVKVLDFGLAKFTHASAQSSDSNVSTLQQTNPGVVMGTVPYMSPEQALGHAVDHRSDLFSLGTVLYEMTTGRLPFAGGNTVETLDCLLHAQPEAMAQFNGEVPVELERIVRRCMEKDQEHRYQSALELVSDLAMLKRSLENGSGSGNVQITGKAAPPIGKVPSFLRRWALVALCVLLLVVGGFGLLKLRQRGTNGTMPMTSIAILPFKNLSGDPKQEYVSDGITESLISEFQKIKALTRVIGSTSVQQFKDTRKSLPEIAKELEVEMIMEGSAIREGDRVGIKARLVEASNGNLRWAQDYDLDMKNARSFYGEVARTVAGEIRLELSPEERKSLTTARPVSPEVQDLLWKGQSFLTQRFGDPGNMSKALASFQEAARLDPNNAEALAGVAESYGLLGNFGLFPQKEAFANLYAAAVRALELDERNARAHIALFFWHCTWQHDWQLGEREIKRAVELAPSDVNATSYYAEWMNIMGRDDEAIKLAKRALAQAPNDLGVSGVIERIYYLARRYDDAISLGKDIFERDETRFKAARFVSSSYLAMKRPDEAWQWFTKMMGSSKAFFKEEDRRRFVEAWRLGGWPAVWREQLLRIDRSNDSLAIKSGDKAALFAQLGEKDKAFAELEMGYREHSSWMFELHNPQFDSIRSDPRFRDLRRRLNFPDEK